MRTRWIRWIALALAFCVWLSPLPFSLGATSDEPALPSPNVPPDSWSSLQQDWKSLQNLAQKAVPSPSSSKNGTPSSGHAAKRSTSTAQGVVIGVGDVGPKALWLNESLAVLGYLPATFSPSAQEPAQAVRLALSAGAHAQTFKPLQGTWKLRYDQPNAWVSLWSADEDTPITEGAVMAFESQHHLAVDGIAGPDVIHALSEALAAGERAPQVPYSYILVTTSLPETLELWVNGKLVLTSLCNTGIPQAPTPYGTYGVYVQYASQEMKGKDPNGTPYDDPDVPYVSYFDQGCAVHGFIRQKYGFPQSLGCVELPYAAAAKVFAYTHIGTLVTITSAPLST
ncbi:L,D-transpeptidase family protein [Alicyclobacillus acidocaldarius]|uniref:ErfK/YbiS/YcfS/YnhG family protein n=1 Tax=Alicyclobacillus acidocaldarius subsp. acidocaldarius (strain ATCC 27009 / DSM 446 / BCRC 14685 / JCM 5260 / KCTC 1825 / NBRC 15652 / NCIMB 11725 / NRRL B-14509 / 104-IA) TaxID=521098 RepID=C8WUQ1_ALIAD|nr:L,D-transpeptidase family protein [Alicyclobacillus acidocaldarius]ACV59867.1 ErfK/YbiS/YcfS/YnhG family protein [Alicyclobacillus acidocaldarius subsp. acidocaldarius DSM 446]